MKNTLAENMLRFGVKNLKESDVKKIVRLQEETQPVQPFAAINTKSWKLKDAAAEGVINNPASYRVRVDPKAAVQGVYGPWAQEYSNRGGDKKMHPNAILIAQDIAVALATIMNAQGIYDPLRYKDFAYVVDASQRISKAIKTKIGDYSVPIETIGNSEPDLALSPNSNQYGEATTQQQWEATLAIIAPAITAVIQQYVVPNAVAKPAPTATPGKTAPAPAPGTRP